MGEYLKFTQENIWFEIWPELSLALGAILILGIELFKKPQSFSCSLGLFFLKIEFRNSKIQIIVLKTHLVLVFLRFGIMSESLTSLAKWTFLVFFILRKSLSVMTSRYFWKNHFCMLLYLLKKIAEISFVLICEKNK